MTTGTLSASGSALRTIVGRAEILSGLRPEHDGCCVRSHVSLRNLPDSSSGLIKGTTLGYRAAGMRELIDPFSRPINLTR